MNRSFEIRLARPDDAPAIATALRTSFIEYESLYTPGGYAATTPKADEITRRFAEGQTWVAESSGEIVGTVSVVPEQDSLYIRSMAVVPAARGAHIGERLLMEIENFAFAGAYKRLFLSTTPFLYRAIRLYESFGFIRNDEPPHELFGTPLVTMSKTFPS